MTPSTPLRRTIGLSLVALLAAFLAIGIVHAGTCAGDCPPGCGDCAACPSIATLAARVDLAAPRAAAGTVPSPVRTALLPASTRPVEHVPLPAAA